MSFTPLSQLISGFATGYTGSSGRDSLVVSETEPTNILDGQLWYKPSEDILYKPSASGWQYIPVATTRVYPPTNGEATYTQPGTYSWVCPAEVNWVDRKSVV